MLSNRERYLPALALARRLAQRSGPRRWSLPGFVASLAAVAVFWAPFGAVAGSGTRDDGAPPPVFEEIPPAASGITWTHNNAMSDQRYLPETLGPGAAFLDYANDGRI